MIKEENANELRISGLTDTSSSKLPLFHTITQTFSDSANNGNKGNSQTIFVGRDSNANIRSSIAIMFARIIAGSFESKNKPSGNIQLGCSSEGSIDNFINCLFKSKIKLHEIQNIPEVVSNRFIQEGRTIVDKLDSSKIELENAYNYFKFAKNEEDSLIQNQDPTHLLANFLMKKHVFSQFLKFVKNFENLFRKWPLTSSQRSSNVYLVLLYFSQHPIFQILLCTSIRSILLFQYELYDAYDYFQQISDHAVYTAMCDIFNCKCMKINGDSRCSFYDRWQIWLVNLSHDQGNNDQIQKSHYFITESIFLHTKELKTSESYQLDIQNQNNYGNSSSVSFKAKNQSSSQQNHNNLANPTMVPSKRVSKRAAEYINRVRKSISIEINQSNDILDKSSEKGERKQIDRPINSLCYSGKNKSNENEGYSSLEILQFLSKEVRETMLTRRTIKKQKYS